MLQLDIGGVIEKGLREIGLHIFMASCGQLAQPMAAVCPLCDHIAGFVDIGSSLPQSLESSSIYSICCKAQCSMDAAAFVAIAAGLPNACCQSRRCNSAGPTCLVMWRTGRMHVRCIACLNSLVLREEMRTDGIIRLAGVMEVCWSILRRRETCI
jgi:hypothetical protein